MLPIYIYKKKTFLRVAKFSKAYGNTKLPHTLTSILLAGMGLLIHSELNTVALIEI